MAMTPWVTWPALAKFGSIGVIGSLLVLGVERVQLLENNMFDMEDWSQRNADITCDERSLTARTVDGTCNILENPAEGSVYMRFGRNVDPEAVKTELEAGTLLTPNPREVSNSLMSRGDSFKPATSLNFIAASWIQFMVHDWFDHGPQVDADPMRFPLPPGDPFGSGEMIVKRTQPDPTRTDADAHLPPTYQNVNTHWWDGSQIYGSSQSVNDSIRAFEGGRLKVDDDGSLPTDWYSGKPITGFSENWWVGLSMLHRLFTLEHNAIADHLAAFYPDATDEWLYDRARLVNSALMAKIHTVEWTPAILANPVLERAMYANWWGIGGTRDKREKYQGELDDLNANLNKFGDLLRLLGISTDLGQGDPGVIDQAFGGLVGSRSPNDYDVPYTLTEEFVSVYRMHPLLRDNIDVYDIGSNQVSRQISLPDTRDGDAEDVLDDVGADRLWYSFGMTHPGALTLNNFPEFMRSLDVPVRGLIDMAAIDILRDRERGTPRYNEFRRQIGLKPITRFEDLTDNPEILSELKRLYNNDIEMIDALVGQLAEETRPDGFGFGETAFQIFILNASRRLMTDRFFTSDYRPEIYTTEGIDWVENNTMIDVIKRHYPTLESTLAGMENAFKPWRFNMPEEYESWTAEAKADHLWMNGVQRTAHDVSNLPSIPDVDIGGLIDRVLWDKVKIKSDVAPKGYEKPIHPRASVARVAFEASANSPYTGLFKGASEGLLRLSVTGDPAARGFAPGLALKLFVDGQPSENISALYTLSGQGGNYNFMANELSNYVSPEVNDTLGSTVLFSLVTRKPTLVMPNAMASVNADGTPAGSPHAPTQIYFVPASSVKDLFSKQPHDFRHDLAALPDGTPVYEVYATSKDIRTSIFSRWNRRFANDRRESATHIGTLVTQSEFVASEFGDSQLFFKHQRYEDR